MGFLTPALLPFAFLLATINFVATPLRAADWPQWLGPQCDGVWRENGDIIIAKLAPEKYEELGHARYDEPDN